MPEKRWFQGVLFTSILALFVYAGLFSTLSTLNFHAATAALGTPMGALFQLALLFGVAMLLHRAMQCEGNRLRFVFLSALCSFCILLDLSFLQQSDWGLLFGTWRDFGSALWVWAALSISLWAFLHIAGDVFERFARAQRRTPTVGFRHTANWKRLLRDSGILLACWLPHIVMQFPGHIETTAGQQIRQAFGELAITRDNPLFHTLWIKAVLKTVIALGGGDTLAVFALSLSQTIPLAVALAWTLRILEKQSVAPILTGGLRVFYCLCPLFPLYGMFIVKDVPFAIALLLFTSMIVEVAQQKDAFFERGWRIALLTAVGVAVCLLRNVAVYLYGVSMLILFLKLRLGSKARWRYLCCCAITVVIFAGFTYGGNALLHVNTLETRQAETRSLQCQVIARIVRNHRQALSQEELAQIDACLPVEGMAERYEPELSDPIKDTWRENVTETQARALDALTLQLALRYPGEAAQALLRMGIPYLTPGDTGRFRSIFDCGFSNISALYPLFKPLHLFDAAVFRSTLDYFQQAPLINFFCCSGLYAWLLLGSGAALIRRRHTELLPGFIPAFLVLLGCLMSPVAGYVRYALPFMFCAPFLTLLTIHTLCALALKSEASLEAGKA